MLSKVSKKVTIVAVALAFVSMTMTSCNRGYGCPMEMRTAAKIVTPFICK